MVEYKLKKPIVLGEETIEVLKLVEPTQERLEAVEYDYAELTTAKGLRLLLCACATNVTEAHIAKMSPKEIAWAGRACQDFFE